MMLWPLFIPSKGRPSCPTLKTLFENKTSFLKPVLVVEPQEAPNYKKTWPLVELITLPASNRGICFVRNYILAMNRAKGVGWFWMLDDDVTGFFVTINKKTIKTPAFEVLSQAQTLAQANPNAAQVALEYQQFSWSATKDVALNSYADVCVGVQAQLSDPVAYRPEMAMKEDRDFTMQLIAAGKDVVRCSKLSFASPKNGSNAGGLQADYALGYKEVEAVKRLVAAWPGVVTAQIKKDGRFDAKIHWRRLRQ